MLTQGHAGPRRASLRVHAPTRSPSETGRAAPGAGQRGLRRSATMERMGARISDRIAAIAESATLAVDAKAKALKAAGRPVIGFGAGEPDFPTPDYIVEAAIEAARDPEVPPLHPGRRAARAARGHRREDPARHRLRRRRRPGAGHQRRQAGRLQHLRHAARPGRRGAAHRAVLDHLPRGDQARRRRPGRGHHRRDHRLPRRRRAARGRAHRRAPRCCCSSRRPTPPARSTRAPRSRPSARWAAEHGLWVVTDEIYEHLVYGDAEHGRPSSPPRSASRSSSSTASPRPTR